MTKITNHIGAIVALLTMIGSIFVGGTTFGSLKGKVNELQFRAEQIEANIKVLEQSETVLKERIKGLEVKVDWLEKSILNGTK